MNYVEFMDVFNTSNDLLEYFTCLLLWNSKNLFGKYFLDLTM